MANPPPPVVVVEKKRGWGCCGCGCFILALLLLLFVVFVGGTTYVSYREATGLTSTTPLPVPTFEGNADQYAAAQKKVTDFLDTVHQHQPAKLEMTADDINSFIVHSPGYAESGSHVFVTLTGEAAQVEMSVPLSALKLGMFEDRYFNGQSTFSLAFDPTTHQLGLNVQDLHTGSTNVPASYLSTLVNQYLNPALNQQLNSDPSCKEVLESAKTIQFQDGELVIETQ